MKKLLSVALLLSIGQMLFAQINPVQGLSWDHEYVFGANYFTLEWDEPALPHDELLGYNIYRENELYRFQTENILYNLEEGSNCDEDFLYFNDGAPFNAHVTAVYQPNNTESGFVETVYIEGLLLSNHDIHKQQSYIYPNPTNGILYIKHSNVTKIRVFDVSGNILKELQRASQINLSEMAKGIYFINLTSDRGMETQRVIIN